MWYAAFIRGLTLTVSGAGLLTSAVETDYPFGVQSNALVGPTDHGLPHSRSRMRILPASRVRVTVTASQNPSPVSATYT